MPNLAMNSSSDEEDICQDKKRIANHRSTSQLCEVVCLCLCPGRNTKVEVTATAPSSPSDVPPYSDDEPPVVAIETTAIPYNSPLPNAEIRCSEEESPHISNEKDTFAEQNDDDSGIMRSRSYDSIDGHIQKNSSDDTRGDACGDPHVKIPSDNSEEKFIHGIESNEISHEPELDEYEDALLPSNLLDFVESSTRPLFDGLESSSTIPDNDKQSIEEVLANKGKNGAGIPETICIVEEYHDVPNELDQAANSKETVEKEEEDHRLAQYDTQHSCTEPIRNMELASQQIKENQSLSLLDYTPIKNQPNESVAPIFAIDAFDAPQILGSSQQQHHHHQGRPNSCSRGCSWSLVVLMTLVSATCVLGFKVMILVVSYPEHILRQLPRSFLRRLTNPALVKYPLVPPNQNDPQSGSYLPIMALSDHRKQATMPPWMIQMGRMSDHSFPFDSEFELLAPSLSFFSRAVYEFICGSLPAFYEWRVEQDLRLAFGSSSPSPQPSPSLSPLKTISITYRQPWWALPEERDEVLESVCR